MQYTGVCFSVLPPLSGTHLSTDMLITPLAFQSTTDQAPRGAGCRDQQLPAGTVLWHPGPGCSFSRLSKKKGSLAPWCLQPTSKACCCWQPAGLSLLAPHWWQLRMGRLLSTAVQLAEIP